MIRIPPSAWLVLADIIGGIAGAFIGSIASFQLAAGIAPDIGSTLAEVCCFAWTMGAGMVGAVAACWTIKESFGMRVGLTASVAVPAVVGAILGAAGYFWLDRVMAHAVPPL